MLASEINLDTFARMVSDQIAQRSGRKQLPCSDGCPEDQWSSAAPRLALNQIRAARAQLENSRRPTLSFNFPDRTVQLNELEKLDDVQFIFAAYGVALGREPDASGKQAYLNHLRSGMPKYLIVHHLCSSEEGRAFGASIAGLSERLALERRLQWPILGPLLRFFSTAEAEQKIAIRNAMQLGKIAADIDAVRDAYDQVLAISLTALEQQARLLDALGEEVGKLRDTCESLRRGSSARVGDDESWIRQNDFARVIRFGAELQVPFTRSCLGG